MKNPTHKTLGILGGLSWASTVDYYKELNMEVSKALGKQHSANLLISSLDFQPVINAQVDNDWQWISKSLIQQAKSLVNANAILIASNTIHLVYRELQSELSVPLLNIFDAIAESCKLQGIKRIGLLGTKYTMGNLFFVEEYRSRGIEIVVPEASDQKIVNSVIFKELIHGRISEESVDTLLKCSQNLAPKKIDAILLGCTELFCLTPHWNIDVPALDSTKIHCQYAAKWVLAELSSD